MMHISITPNDLTCFKCKQRESVSFDEKKYYRIIDSSRDGKSYVNMEATLKIPVCKHCNPDSYFWWNFSFYLVFVVAFVVVFDILMIGGDKVSFGKLLLLSLGGLAFGGFCGSILYMLVGVLIESILPKYNQEDIDLLPVVKYLRKNGFSDIKNTGEHDWNVKEKGLAAKEIWESQKSEFLRGLTAFEDYSITQ